jgi:hypothetical protein
LKTNKLNSSSGGNAEKTDWCEPSNYVDDNKTTYRISPMIRQKFKQLILNKLKALSDGSNNARGISLATEARILLKTNVKSSAGSSAFNYTSENK